MTKDSNQDDGVISHFAGEWKAFNYLDSDKIDDIREQFDAYCKPLPKDFLVKENLVVADFGAGSGRWAHFLLPYSKELWLVEPGIDSFEVLKERFSGESKVKLLNETVSENSVPDNSLDLAVSLGVLHHIPNTQKGITDIFKKIKPGGLFLGYLYYSLENKPLAYRVIWRISDGFRRRVSKLPHRLRRLVCELIAILVYFPLARISRLTTRLGMSSSNIPLHHYQDMTLYVMRNDAFDRFGTSLEQRFTKAQIQEMLNQSGFDISSLNFSDEEPFWTFSVSKPV